MTRSPIATTIAFVTCVAVAGCSGGTTVLPPAGPGFPSGTTATAPTTADVASASGCRVSSDNFVWYALPAGAFPPIDFRYVTCATRTSIDASRVPAVPQWARVPATTQALFVATSLQEAPSSNGMAAIEADASAAHVPVTWMVGDASYLSPSGLAAHDADHTVNGDDVELEPHPQLYALASHLSWYAPAVSVEGAGHERDVAGLRALGNDAFWGITWNSHGTDGTSDEGAPFGSYCADPSSYKRPAPDGTCSLVAFEWTARDLTRAFFANTNPSGYSSEAAFSTDPDDVLLRGGFDGATAVAYERELVDAYAAAGETQPLVVMSQQETADEGTRGPEDDPVLAAIYDEARRSGMRPTTLRSADAIARSFSSQPRAVAIPYLAGGLPTSFDGAGFTPSTIDYHDTAAGMTFVAGRTLPERVFAYADDPVSKVDAPLIAIAPGDVRYPSLTGVTAANGTLRFAFDAPVALHFGVAIWTDPTALAGSAGIVRAGHAGYVAAFDLPAGASVQSVPCGCTGTTFAYSR